FFQAEDGIRDFHVTGVQTCALPIYRLEHGRVVSRATGRLRTRTRVLPAVPRPATAARGPLRAGRHVGQPGLRPPPPEAVPPGRRSEERRVGKERRPQGWQSRESNET